MRNLLCIAACICTAVCHGDEPPRRIPSELESAYTLGGKIPVEYEYKNESMDGDIPFYSEQWLDAWIEEAKHGGIKYYHDTDPHLHVLFRTYPDLLQGKRVAIMGSRKPWYEAMVIAYGGNPVTIEYGKIETDDQRLTIYSVEEFLKNPETFDVILSISSFEHDGLGRYGDPLNPTGDIEAMQKAKGMLNPDGFMVLVVPIGKDRIVWNLHRVYGEVGFPKLIQGWEVVESFGFIEGISFQNTNHHPRQPVFLLRPLPSE